MKTLIPTLFLVLIAVTSLADELVVLETYHRDDWVSFHSYQGLSSFVDSTGSIYVTYTLLRESEWPQSLLRCYPQGQPARGGDITSWGPGSWWRSRVCRIDGDNIDVQLDRGTDYFPMPIEHKLLLINQSNGLSMEEKYTRIVTDTQFNHLRRTTDSTASAFSVDHSIWGEEVVRFLSNIKLYNSHQYDSLPLEVVADTLWESPSSNNFVIDAKIPNSDIYSALYNRYSDTIWGFVCLSNDQVIMEIDSLFPVSVSNLSLKALGNLFMFTWSEADEMYFQTFNPIDTSFSKKLVYYTEGESSLNSRVHVRLGIDDNYFYRQTPVLNDFNSSNPPNWHSIIRQTINRDDFAVTSIDTVFTFHEPPLYATHSLTQKEGVLHSLIATNEESESYLYYYGPSSVVSSDEAVQKPNGFILSEPFPNPFNGQVQIKLEIPIQLDLQINIYDIHGRIVYSQQLHGQKPGTLDLSWSGNSNSGLTVSSGLYLFQVQGQGYTASQKLVLLK